jgi:hypothetical protein
LRASRQLSARRDRDRRGGWSGDRGVEIFDRPPARLDVDKPEGGDGEPRQWRY